jgi:hypothetical protein
MSPGDDEWPLRASDAAFTSAGWARQAETIYAAALKRQDVDPLTATLWIEHWVKRPHWGQPPKLAELLARGPVGSKAAFAYLGFPGRTGKLRKVLACIRRHHHALRADTQCWGIGGYALLAVNQPRAVVNWLSDWRDRDDAQSWMLLNLVYALRALRRDREANEVSRRAAALAPDHCTPYHFLWLILDHLFDGQAAMARGGLEGLDLSTFDSRNSYLYRLALLLLELSEARPNLSRGARRKASRDLASMNRSLRFGVDTHAAIVQLFHRAVRFMARDYGRIDGIFWKLAARMNPPLKRV